MNFICIFLLSGKNVILIIFTHKRIFKLTLGYFFRSSLNSINNKSSIMNFTQGPIYKYVNLLPNKKKISIKFIVLLLSEKVDQNN